MKHRALITITALAILYFWIDPNGLLRTYWMPDGSYYAQPTPPPHLRPPTNFIVHPHIQPAATPRPGTGRPPAI